MNSSSTPAVPEQPASVATPTRRIKVAAILDTWIISGPGRQLAALTGALRPLGVDLQIVMFQRDGRPPSPYIAYLEKIGLAPVVIRDRGRFDVGAARRLAAALRELNPDIVQSHGYRPTGLVSLLRLTQPSWRWIGFFHGATTQDLKDRLYHRLDLALLRRAERLVVLCKEHQGWFADVGSKVRLIHNAALTLPPPATALEFSHLRRSGGKLIGVVARLSREKAVDILIEALFELRQMGSDVTLAIAGDGPEEPKLRSQAEALGLTPHVHFLGRIGDVSALYKVLDLLVIPSRDGAEGLPNVLLEALSADVPVVATRVAAVPEVLTDNRAGIVVPPGDAGQLAAAARMVLSADRDENSTIAREATVGRFSLGKRAALHCDMYRELLND